MNPYEVLGVPENASEEEIKKAISLGYEVAASNITAETIHTQSTSYLTNKITYYALVIRK